MRYIDVDEFIARIGYNNEWFPLMSGGEVVEMIDRMASCIPAKNKEDPKRLERMTKAELIGMIGELENQLYNLAIMYNLAQAEREWGTK